MRASSLTGGALAIVLSVVFTNSASALAPWPNDKDKYRGAPAPIVGAGLPALAIAAGAYFLIRRSRRNPD